jgi:hypothetical protein
MRNVALGALVSFIGSQLLYWLAATYSSLPIFFLAQGIHGLIAAQFYPFTGTLIEHSFKKRGLVKNKGFFKPFTRHSRVSVPQ